MKPSEAVTSRIVRSGASLTTLYQRGRLLGVTEFVACPSVPCRALCMTDGMHFVFVGHTTADNTPNHVDWVHGVTLCLLREWIETSLAAYLYTRWSYIMVHSHVAPAMSMQQLDMCV